MLGWQEQKTRAGESQQPTVIKESVIYLWPKYVNRHVYDKTNSYPRLHSVPHTIFSFFFPPLTLHPDQWRRKKRFQLSFLFYGEDFFFREEIIVIFFFNKKNQVVFSPEYFEQTPRKYGPCIRLCGVYRRRYMCIISFVSRVLLNVWKQPPRKIQGKNTSLSYRNKVTVPFLALSVKIYM